ncbi:MAG: hypothetical protein ACREV1_19185 [Gammaproteobacteria bacterium]
MVLGEGDDIRRLVEKAREVDLETAGMWLTDDLAKQRFLGREVGPVLGAERTGVAQPDAIFDTGGGCVGLRPEPG